MITEDKYKELLSKIDVIIDTEAVHASVSPTSEKSGAGFAAPDNFILTKETDVEKLSQNELLLTHALLHQFHASGGVSKLDIKDIEKLHKEVKEKLKNHQDFDRLDKI